MLWRWLPTCSHGESDYVRAIPIGSVLSFRFQYSLSGVISRASGMADEQGRGLAFRAPLHFEVNLPRFNSTVMRLFTRFGKFSHDIFRERPNRKKS